MKIAVTGASGFVGRALTESLKCKGHRLVLLSHKNPPQFSKDDNIEVICADVHDYESLKAAFDGVDIVYHLIGIIAETRELTFERTVVSGATNVVRAAQECGVSKIIYMSALGTQAEAMAVYHRSKWKAEESVRNSGIEHVILRASIIFGPEDKFLNMIAGMIKKSPFVPIIGDGKYLLQPVFINDLAEILSDCIDNIKAVNQTIEVGGPFAYSYKDLLAILKRHLNKKRINIYLPLWLMRIVAYIMERLLKPAPLTTDQLIMMKAGSSCDNKKLHDVFIIELTKLEDGLKKYMR